MTITSRRLLSAIIFLSTIAITLPVQAASATFSVSPSSGNYHTGDTVNVTIGEDSGSETVSTIQADLQYPAGVLQYTGVNADSSAFSDVAPPPSVSNGVVSMTRGSIAGQTGRQTVIIVKFKAIADGSANFAMANSSAIFRQSDAANLYAGSTTAGAPGTSSQASSSSVSVQASNNQHVTTNSTSSSTGGTPTPTTSTNGKPSPTPSLVQIITSKNKAANGKPAGHIRSWLLLIAILGVIGFLAVRLWLRRKQGQFSSGPPEPPVPPVTPPPAL